MKPTDLKIGNYLLDKEDRICMVEGLSKLIHDCRIYAVKGATTTMPIRELPLTRQILLDSGAKTSSDESLMIDRFRFKWNQSYEFWYVTDYYSYT